MFIMTFYWLSTDQAKVISSDIIQPGPASQLQHSAASVTAGSTDCFDCGFDHHEIADIDFFRNITIHGEGKSKG